MKSWLLFVLVHSVAVPPPIEKMIAARQSLLTGRVEWVRVLHADPHNPRTDEFVSRFAATQRLTETQPRAFDSNSYIRKADGTPLLDERGGKYFPGRSPLMVMNTPGQVWQRLPEEATNKLFETSVDFAEVQVPDPRAFGCGHSNSGGLEYAVLGEFTETDREPVRLQAHRDGALWVVRADYAQHKRIWWIDPERGWNPTRAQVLEVSGEVQFETLSELREMDGVWFPHKITTYAGESAGNRVYETIAVVAAEFNKPEHSLVLAPVDIGIRFGEPVNRVSERMAVLDQQVFDGAHAVSRQEFQARRDRGEFDGKAIVATAAAGPASSGSGRPSAVLIRLSKWEQYTADFVRKHALDSAQTEGADRILRGAQAAGNRVIKKHEDTIRAAEERLSNMNDVGLRAETERKIGTLLSPLDTIFERSLKSRLERLPTRAQRQAAEK